MKYFIILIASALATFPRVYAQDPEQQEVGDTAQISDDELKKYAVTMDSINDMKASLLEEINEMVKDSEMTNSRYNELSKITDDETKLAEAKATETEKALLKKVAERKNEGTEDINSTFQNLAKDYVGVESYNKIRKALTTDAELKTRYEAMLKDLEQNGE